MQPIATSGLPHWKQWGRMGFYMIIKSVLKKCIIQVMLVKAQKHDIHICSAFSWSTESWRLQISTSFHDREPGPISLPIS